MKIVIISPTFNEKINVQKLIPVLEEEVFPKIKNHELSLLIVDDNSPDGTADEVRTLMKKWKNVHLLEGQKNGLGAAYARGMKYAMDTMKADAVIEFDSDFQHDPHDIKHLIAAMDEGYDHVIGSRYIKGGKIPQAWGIDRKFLSYFGSLFTRIVWLNFKIHDMTSGFKLTKTSFLKRVDLDNLLSNQFAYKMHILHDMVRLGAKIKEIPIVFYERQEGTSKISKKDQLDSLYVVLRLGIYDLRRVIKFLVVGGVGFILQFIVSYIAIMVGIEQFIATTLGAETAILSNFLFNNFWTFRDTKSIKQQGSFLRRLFKFNFASVASILIQTVVSFLAVRQLGEMMNVFGYSFHTSLVIIFPTIILVVIPLNYLIYNKLIWKTQYLRHEKSS